MGYMESNQGLARLINTPINMGGPILKRANPANIHKAKHEKQRTEIQAAVAAQTAVARRQQVDLLAQAEAAAAEQANLTMRAAAEKKAADLMDNPMETADVQLSPTSTDTVTATRAKKRKQFGFDTSGYSPGAKL